MEPRRYEFNTIFTYNAAVDIIIPRYRMIINNVILEGNVPIKRGMYLNGLDLFNYIGHAMAGIWDEHSNTLTITGFF